MRQGDTFGIARDRIARVYKYLQALNEHRNPVVRHITEQPWKYWLRDLPAHECVKLTRPASMDTAGDEEAGLEEPILRVRRPLLTKAPSPPESIVSWLVPGWGDALKGVQLQEPRNEVDQDGMTRVVRFEDDPARPMALSKWKPIRDAWARSEVPALQTMKLFESLYELHGRIERESERVELVLGDGILGWRRPEGAIFHPVLLQRVHLAFNPSLPEFTIADSGRQVELYTGLFRSMEDVDARALSTCREELAKGGFGPLGHGDTAGFLKRLSSVLAAKAELIADGSPKADAEVPQIGRDPVVFLRARNQGFAIVLDEILQDVLNREHLPTSLLRIVGTDPGPEAVVEETNPTESWTEPENILLSKPANPEQIQIAQRLDQHGCVLVQGPPGTGKTHTIANLIGHLLVQGKSVLVTSHTTKALNVLRGQVVAALRPLCVSVLDNDLESRSQMEGAVQAIAEKLSSSDAEALAREAGALTEQRKQIVSELLRLRRALLDAQADEYRDVVFGGRSFPPSDAARKVAEEASKKAWIPMPVKLGAALPLSEEEVRELYRTNNELQAGHEVELGHALPNPSDLALPQDLAALWLRRRALTEMDLGFRQELWATPPTGKEDAQTFEKLARRAFDAVEPLGGSDAWKLAIVAAGMGEEAERSVWQSLLSMIRSLNTDAAQARELLLNHAPSVGGTQLSNQLAAVSEVLQHLKDGGGLGALTFLAHGSWRRLIRESKVASGEPRTAEHFRAIEAMLRLKQFRQDLAGRWDRQMGALGAPLSSQMGEVPEQAWAQFCAEIERCLSWAESTLKPVQTELKRCGLNWTALLDELPPNLAPHGNLLRLRDAVVGPLQRVLTSRARAVEKARLDDQLAGLMRSLDRWGGAAAPSRIVRSVFTALRAESIAAYEAAYSGLVDVVQRRDILAKRRALLTRLDAVAPGWAQALRERREAHGRSEPPGAPEDAWMWRQLNDELERRGQVQLSEVQGRIEAQAVELRRITAELIERRAWAWQARRTSLPQRQALEGWLKLVQKIGKGTGKTAARYRAEAARKMNECKDAVPVWVMPLSKVVEHFSAGTRFDVVIVDEASQSDILALVALYLAERVIVVGDHEQVSPSAVGQNVTVVQNLIATHLDGIPNAILYDGQTSIYDLAKSSFGGVICLSEHFRCVPEIIEFSNQLSYGGRIKPLREASSSSLKPALVTHRVEGRAEAKVNVVEAKAVAALVAAVAEHPAYSGKTIGAVSLVGEEQAIEIERLLRQHMAPVEYERRRILCGNASQFQGDERDLMFLSMVDSPSGDGPLVLRADQKFKQRFNVAASRARDQMWVVHSLNPGVDLKPDDLRRKLLDHCANPFGLSSAIQRAAAEAESAFEREVLGHLVRAGYRVLPQYEVGYYRIDLVVEGGGQRLAVECDGDKYHPLSKLPEDMARQAILERLGWKFVRLRGSAFFRDQGSALRPVFRRLQELGIPPEGAEPGQSDCPPATALYDEIVRRAQALEAEWQEHAERDAAPEGKEGASEVRRGRRGRPFRPPIAAAPVAAPRAAAVDPGGREARESPERASSKIAPVNQDSINAGQRVPVVPGVGTRGALVGTPAVPIGQVRPAESGSPSVGGQEAPRPTTASTCASDRVTIQRVGKNLGTAATAGPNGSGELARTMMEQPIVRAQASGPSRPSRSVDPLLEALAIELGESALTCSACGANRRPWVGKYGPFLKCDSPTCAKTESVAPPILRAALQALGAKCDCGAPLKVATGPTGSTFVGCSDYPRHSKSCSWKDFRDRLRNELKLSAGESADSAQQRAGDGDSKLH